MSNLTTRQTIKVKVNQLDGSLVPQNKAPVVLKNTIQQTPNLNNLGDIQEQDVVQGATLVYNSTTGKYEIKPISILELADVVGTPSNNDVLFYNEELGAFVYGNAPLAIGNLADVDTTDKANGTVLIYDSASNTYIHGIVPIASANGTVSNINTSNLSVGNSSVTVNSISSFANSTQLGSSASGSASEIVTAAAVKTYIDELLAVSGGGGGGGAINLNGLIDVDINALAAGQVLVYDGNTNQWVNKSIVGIGDINVEVGTGGNIEISFANNFQIPEGISANVVGANTVNANTINLSSLTQNRIVVAGPDGLLSDSADLTWNGTVLTVTGNGSITGQLTVAGSASITNNIVAGNNVDVGNNLLVSNGVSIGRALTVSGNTTIAGNTVVGGNASISGLLSVSNNAIISGNLSAADASFNSLVIGTTSQFDGTITSKDIIPAADITYSLGTANNRFKDLFVGPGSVYVGSVVLSDSNGKMAVSSESDYTNTVTFNANTIFAANLEIQNTAFISGNLIPTNTGTFNLGSSSSAWNQIYANSLVANTGNISGNLVVGGNLTVQGDTTRVNVSTVNVEDPIIRLASNNTTTNSVDIGFYGSYYNGVAITYTGIVRDASNNGVYVLFDQTRTEPTTTLDYSDQYLRLATLNAYISGGGLYTNATNVYIAGDQSTDVTIHANTVTMSRPLNVASGGTGRQSLLNNHVLVGKGTDSMGMITGSNNQLLAVVGGVPTFVSSIDAGTF